MKGYALSSFVDGVPITEAIASALLMNLRRLEALWSKDLTDPQNPAARVWRCAANVELRWSPEIGKIDLDPELAVIQLVPALPPGTPEGFIADHDVDEIGRPRCSISYVACGSDWPAAAAHELESRVNPMCDRRSPPAPDGTRWDLETADPVQGSDYVEPGTTIPVANHVGPAFFGLDNGPLDIAGVVKAPFEELATGYHDGSAGQVFGERVSDAKRQEVVAHGVRGKKQRAQKRATDPEIRLCGKEVTPGGRTCVEAPGHEGRCVGC
jgi:hypothetical protein